LEKFALDRQLEIHKSRVKQFLADGQSPSFPIEETCRIDNGGVLKIPANIPVNKMQPWVALVPAAGAASRYVSPLANLANAAKQKNQTLLQEEVAALKKLGADQWPLPNFVKILLSNDSKIDFEKISEVTEYPKAFFPAMMEGQTFFELKCIEHRKMEGVEAEVFVTPRGRREGFAKNLERFSLPKLSEVFIEQDDALSTVRFSKNLEIVSDPNGQPSRVPAGHGALVSIFPEIKRKFPSSRFALIRNIDNIVGTSKVVLKDCETFNAFANFVQDEMTCIRDALREDETEAAKFARQFAEFLGYELISQKPQEILLEVSRKIFHTPESILKSASLADLYERPVNILGMVPNLGTDVGGTPCFVKIKGELVKLCIELPHAIPKDKARFLERSDQATHFNPVWVAAELTNDIQNYYPVDHPFWLVSKKQYLNQEVYYFESILYEILSCSLYSNVLFVEIPRRLFNPNKSLMDAAGRKIKDWL